MSEITVITTVEITKIYKNVNDNFKSEKLLKKILRKLRFADDVVVTKVQEFEL